MKTYQGSCGPMGWGPLEGSNVAVVFQLLCLHYHFDLPLHACFD